jgi:flagellar basal-body rod protein FlgB
MRILDSIFNETVTGLTKAMDLTWERNKAISSNVANAATPQYRAVDVQFGQELAKAFQSTSPDPVLRTHGKHLDLQRNEGGKMVEDLSGATRADGNNVDLDLQMASLASNASEFATAAQLIKSTISRIRFAIRSVQ